jgi:hypothetical protein
MPDRSWDKNDSVGYIEQMQSREKRIDREFYCDEWVVHIIGVNVH